MDARGRMWMNVDGCKWIWMETHQKCFKIDNSVFSDPPGVKSHALNSFLVVPMSNSRILAQILLASSCLGGNHEVKSICMKHASFKMPP